MESVLSINMKTKSKKQLQFTLGIIAYALGLVAYNLLYESVHLWRFKYVLLLLPVIPLLYTVATIISSVSEADEMWRKIITESAAFAGLATAFTCFSFLFVDDLGGVFRPEWGFYVFLFYYGVGSVWSKRRLD